MRPLVPAALGFAAALLLSESMGAYAVAIAAVFALVSIVLLIVRRRAGAATLLVRSAAIFTCAAVVGAAWHLLFSAVFYSPAVEVAGTSGRFCATVRGYPTVYDYGASVEVEIDDANGARARLWLDDAVELAPGDRIEFDAVLGYPETLPDFDFLEYYRAKRVFLSGDVSEIVTIERAERTPLRFLPKAFSHALSERLALLYEGDDLAVVRALTVGDRSGMSDALKLELRASGLSHLLAISGLHITLLCGMILALFGRFRRKGALIAILFVGVFVLTSGAAPSATRAFVMHGLALGAMLLRRDADPASAMSLALLLLLAVNPFSVGDLGLQLSFLGTLGLILHLEKAVEWVEAKFLPKMRMFRRVYRIVVTAVLTTVIATLYTTPLIAYTFGSVAIFGVFANLLAMFFVPIALAGGLLSGLVAFVLLDAAEVVAAVVTLASTALRGVAGAVARTPFSIIDTANPYNLCAMALGYALLLVWRATASEGRGKLCAACAAASLLLALGLGEAERRCVGMEATVLSVGQGQSILLESKGAVAMVDCGGDGYGGAGCIAAEELMLRGRRSVDALVLTHFHDDHANGIADLLRFISVESAYIPHPFEDSDNEIIELLKASGTEIHFVEDADETVTLGDASLTVYRPVARSSENEQGMCVLATRDDFDLLVTGDLSSVSEKILLERTRLESVEAIVAGHHGSRNSTGERLLDALTPQVAVISTDGASYGHPHRSTLERLEEHGCDVYRTDYGGHIRLRVG